MLSLSQYQQAFKSYDIRNIRGKYIDEEFGFFLGRGLGEYIAQTTGQQAKILIAADTRKNNTNLISNTLYGLSQEGITHIVSGGMDFEEYPYGICSTSYAYALGYQNYDYTIIFSASHNTAEYIGIKIVTKENKFIPTSKLKKLFINAFNKHSDTGFTTIPLEQGLALLRAESIQESLDKNNRLLDKYFGELEKTHHFAVDYGHGAAVAYELDYLTTLQKTNSNIKTLDMFTNPDGTFPAHETDTSRFKNYPKLLQQVQENNLDFGFMFDGDADRLGIVLADGTIITGDILTAIVAKQALTNGMATQFGSKKVFYEVFSSKVVAETVAKYGGESTMVRVGRGAFCEQVIDEKGLIAGECSAHILFGPLGTAEMPLLALALIIKESENFDNFKAMADHYMSSHKSQVYHFAVSDKDGLLTHIDESFPDLEKNYIDGVRMSGDGYWFTARKSGTEDIVKVAGEGDTKEIFDTEWAKIKKVIIDFGGREE